MLPLQNSKNTIPHGTLKSPKNKQVCKPYCEKPKFQSKYKNQQLPCEQGQSKRAKQRLTDMIDAKISMNQPTQKSHVKSTSTEADRLRTEDIIRNRQKEIVDWEGGGRPVPRMASPLRFRRWGWGNEKTTSRMNLTWTDPLGVAPENEIAYCLLMELDCQKQTQNETWQDRAAVDWTGASDKRWSDG